jgi:hypothetical protein
MESSRVKGSLFNIHVKVNGIYGLENICRIHPKKLLNSFKRLFGSFLFQNFFWVEMNGS